MSDRLTVAALTALALFALPLFAAALTVTPAPVMAQGAVTILAIEGRTNQNVTLAASGQFVVAAWSATAASGSDLYMATSLDGGGRFGEPVRMNSNVGEVRGDGEQAPRAPRRRVARAGQEYLGRSLTKALLTDAARGGITSEATSLARE